jgi:surface carbohydrate biosynthesis protein (TIGR04326 family)
MSVPNEYSFSMDSLAYKAVRLWAFVDLAVLLDFRQIRLVDPDPDVAAILRVWGKETGRVVTLHRSRNGTTGSRELRNSIRAGTGVASDMALAAWILAREFFRYRFKRSKPRHARGLVHDEVTVVDYFTGFQVDGLQPARYASRYWGQLPNELAHIGKPVHWIHLDLFNPDAPKLSVAHENLTELNSNHVGQRHSLLQDLMSLKVMVTAVRTYGEILRLGLVAKFHGVSWAHASSGLDMWPVVKGVWWRSMYGSAAAQNALWLALFESAVRDWQITGPCLYLMENQAWELALVSALEDSGGRAFGVQHGVVREWDLRYALGSDGASKGTRRGLPTPEAVLVNGPKARSVLISNGCEVASLREVEALRYIRAKEPLTRTSGTFEPASQRINALALGEYDPGVSSALLGLLNLLVESRSTKVRITYRPHPSSTPSLAALDRRIVLSTEPSIEADLADNDVVICSNVSAGAVDAMLAGRRRVIFRNGGVLDGQLQTVGVGQVTIDDGRELIEAVGAVSALENVAGEAREVFFLDPRLVRWKMFFSNLR